MESGMVRERVIGLVIAKNRAVELPVVRTTVVTSGDVYNAVQQLKAAIRTVNATGLSSFDFHYVDDTVIPGEGVLSLLGLRKGKKSK